MPASPLLLAQRSPATRWGVLLALTGVLTVALTYAHLPAALLIGALIAGIVVELNGGQLRLPRPIGQIAQAIIGCLVANAFTPEVLHIFVQQWPLFIGIGLSIIIFNCAVGWAVSKQGALPGTTAIWGLLPGGASAMIVMAEHYGADVRLVAFIQYLRIALVAVCASVIASFWTHGVSMPAHTVIWFPVIQWTPFSETLALIAASVIVGRVSGSPTGIILTAMFVGATLHLTGLMQFELPRWLLAIGYVCLGWQVGFRFTRGVIVHALRMLPRITLFVMAGIVFCGALALALMELLHVDFLTAYLATSPGGFDAAAIIAASTHVDLGFVMTMQTIRLLLVLFIGPLLSRWFSGTLGAQPIDISANATSDAIPHDPRD